MEETKDSKAAEPGQEPGAAEDVKAPHPLKVNLDAFTERLETLSETLRLSMTTLEFAHKEVNKRFREFLDGCAIPDPDDADTFQIPAEQFGEFQRHQKRLKKGTIAFTSIPRSHVVALVSEFDAFIGSLLKTLFLLKPDALAASQKPFTFADLTEIGSIQEAREYLIEREVESLLRDSHADQFRTLESRFGLPLTKDLSVWPSFIELTERRNLFVHNRGIVTRNYLEKCREHGYDCGKTARGDVLDAPHEYFTNAFEIVYELAVKLTHVFWRKLDKETIEYADAHFNYVIYDLVKQRNYKLAQVLADFGVSTLKKFASDYTRRSLVVNRAQAYVWGGEKANGLKILEEEDWSAAKDEFQVCRHALKSDHKTAIEIMRSIGSTGRPTKDDYREWPVFKELRKTEGFQKAFKEIFNEPFATVKLSSSSSTSPSVSPSASASPSSSVSPSMPEDESNDGDEDPPKVH